MLKVEVSRVPGKPGSDSSWATDQLCDLGGPMSDLSRPVFHHLQNGNNNTFLTGLLWDEMKKMGLLCPVLVPDLGSHRRAPLTPPPPPE